MNNGESVKKYNDLLIKFLNDLVNNIEDNNANELFFADIASRLKKHLVTYNLDIADQGVKTLMANAFKEYSSILKKYFDSSNIHRINLNENDVNITTEMNQVTADLASAVTNMNKIPEYANLVNRVKTTLKGYFNQNYPSYQSIEFEIEQILNEVIVGSFNTFTSRKIEDFTRDILPELYTIADSITYDTTINNVIVEDNTNINEERDAFINETMDIEIEEGFENGVVTLKVVDANGNTNIYRSVEAMEKLTSYNQLFESSRPGKKVDTSNWALDISNQKQEEVNTSQNNNISFNNEANNVTETIDNKPDDNVMVDNNSSSNSNEALIKNFLSNYSNNPENQNNSNSLVDDIGNITNTSNLNDIVNPQTDFNNLVINNQNQNANDTNIISPSIDPNLDNSSDNNTNNNNTGNDYSTTVNNNSDYNNLINSIVGNDDTSTSSLEPSNNNDTTNYNAFDSSEKIVDDDLQRVRNAIGIDENSYSSGFSFLPDYNNPNEERDAFIKKATGIEIEEDTDNQGDLYLKVTEPTGREQIYTGKEAVRMIKNFNKTYLDANPGKTVDTSLINNFKE